MVIIPKYETSISLFHISGTVQVFKSKAAALKELGAEWIRRNVGRHLGKSGRRATCGSFGFRYDCGRDNCTCAPVDIHWIMRDDAGSVVEFSDFRDLITFRRKLGRWGHRSRPVWNGEGSVPGIRKWRGGGSGYRPISHMNERRAAIFFEEEGEVAPRPSRSVTHLPNPWDDYCRGDYRNKTWKRHRNNQWKKDEVSYRTIDWNFDD